MKKKTMMFARDVLVCEECESQAHDDNRVAKCVVCGGEVCLKCGIRFLTVPSGETLALLEKLPHIAADILILVHPRCASALAPITFSFNLRKWDPGDGE